MTSLKTSIKTITYLSDIGCLEIQGASLTELNMVAAKPYPRKTSQTPLYAVGVVPARRQLQPGRISALAGRRAAYERVPDN